jgi:muramidase (phage lysozyme)
MERIKEKKILHLLGNIYEKLNVVSDKVDSGSVRYQLLQYKYQFKQAQLKLKKKFEAQ